MGGKTCQPSRLPNNLYVNRFYIKNHCDGTGASFKTKPSACFCRNAKSNIRSRTKRCSHFLGACFGRVVLGLHSRWLKTLNTAVSAVLHHGIICMKGWMLFGPQRDRLRRSLHQACLILTDSFPETCWIQTSKRIEQMNRACSHQTCTWNMAQYLAKASRASVNLASQ